MAQKKLFLAVVALYLAYRFGTKNVTPGEVVETELGKVQGIELLSRDGREFYEWRGIPFAEPPVGELRFQTPRPATKWAGIRDGSSYGPECAQLDMFLLFAKGSEDCLHLNIAVPKDKFHGAQNAEPRLPVMVWIHGGYFFAGSGSDFNPKYFMDEDVVLVTINYRLGALGFLSTQDENARGNMGLKDQALALKWVKDNIHAFGGNPDSITVFGESAGGASAHIQMLSSKNKGIITRAISQSGSALAHWFHHEDPVGQAHDYAKRVGCPSDSNAELVKCLKRKGVDDLLAGQLPHMAIPSRAKRDIFVPVIETIKDDEAFLTKSAKDIYAAGEAPAVPWMTGTTTEEGLYIIADFVRNKTNIKAALEDHSFLERTFLLVSTPINPTASSRIRRFYLGNEDPVDMSRSKAQDKMCQAGSDLNFVGPCHEGIELHVEKTKAPVYPYLYAKRGPSIVDLINIFQGEYSPMVEFAMYMVKHLWQEFVVGKPEKPSMGAAHTDELFMLFELYGGIGAKVGKNSIFYDFSKKMIKSWVQFASGKTPNFDGLDFPRAANSEDFKYIVLNDTVSLTYILEDGYKFWKTMKM